MVITTCYTAPILEQLVPAGDGFKRRAVDGGLMRASSAHCLEALKFCASAFLKHWDALSAYPASMKPGQPYRRREADKLVHSTAGAEAVFPEFDVRFPCMPAYTRRAIVADALGIVSSYVSNHRN